MPCRSRWRHARFSDYTPWPDLTETAVQDAIPAESYGNFGLVGVDDSVDQPVSEQVLSHLDTGRKWAGGERLEDAWPCEANERPRFGHRQVSQRRPGHENA